VFTFVEVEKSLHHTPYTSAKSVPMEQQHYQQVAPTVPPREEEGAVAPAPAYDSWEDKKYFDEYGKLDIHCDMLHDISRMQSYYNAITQNPQDFKDKVILDVGCGSGVLSCWCAKAGAKKVYAVEASPIADQAELVVLRNGLSNVVQVIQGKIENITLPEKVDVIISEWMGSFLLFESMLETVLFARDRWLKKNGKLYPAFARLYVAPISIDNYWNKKVNFLKDVYGIDMSPLVPFAKKELTTWGIRGRRVKADSVLGESQLIKEVDVYTVQPADLSKTTAVFNFKCNRKANFHGFVSWFEVIFPVGSGGEPVVLSTAPDKLKTHWRHDQFLMEQEIPVDEGTQIAGCLRMLQNVYWKRHFDFEFSFSIGNLELHKLFST